ncbi:MAG: hypothetical protein H6735_30565 [Alphaproteobacteria bacterium]|nr:hypothetical protein [Alphaproteobacteria bacterium]
MSHGDRLSGTFTNVGRFEVPAGAVVTVASRVPLEIEADTIVVAGTIDGTGAGEPGGLGTYESFWIVPYYLGGVPYVYCTSDNYAYYRHCQSGTGPGGGHCGPSDANGGGGSYGGRGDAPAGAVYGSVDAPSDRPLGSGGGGGSSIDCVYSTSQGGRGGTGGGSVVLRAPVVAIDGTVTVAGTEGQSGVRGMKGGSGSGGSLVVFAETLTGTGALDAAGGVSTSGAPVRGGGGRIKVLSVSGRVATMDAGTGTVYQRSCRFMPSEETCDGLDNDCDGLIDDQDPETPGCAPPLDTDGDRLPDAEEAREGTDPNLADTDGDGVDDGIEVFFGTDPLSASGLSLSGPAPGVAGVPNTWEVAGAQPGDRVFLVAGSTLGQTRVPGCVGVTVALDTLGLVGNATADAGGVATIAVSVPPAAGGQTAWFQAVAPAECVVSLPARTSFP